MQTLPTGKPPAVADELNEAQDLAPVITGNGRFCKSCWPASAPFFASLGHYARLQESERL